jgi:hypothetical protein
MSLSDAILKVTIQQKGQLNIFADTTSYGEVYQNQQREQQHTVTGVSTIVNGEMYYEEIPDLYFEESEEIWNRKC